MAKDLIIGAAANYTYDQVKFWINSIKKTGYDGDVMLVVTNMKNDDLEKIAEQGVQILAYGQKDEKGYTNNSGMAPHVERFFHLWNYLVQCDPYRYVVVTDVRDVVFQKNPIEYLETNLGHHSFIAVTEGLLYKDEPWGNQNYYQAFGPYFHGRMKDKEIYNVGVLAGKHMFINDVLLLLFQMSLNRPIPIVDQAVYNFILRLNTIYTETMFVPNDDEWAVNLGTTLPAIQSGAGDIGMRNDPTALILYQSKYRTGQPEIKDGVVYNSHKEKVCIVHQYDRVAGLKEEMEKLYG